MFLSALRRLDPDTPQDSRVVAIGDGKQGTHDTLVIMAGLVKDYKKDSHIRDLALQLLDDEHKNFRGQIESVFDWVRDHIRYVLDVADIESINDPLLTLEQSAGDCDDKSVLLAAMLESIGHKCRFVAVGFNGQYGEFSHVFVETRVGQNWLALDSTEKVPAGWRPPNVTNYLVVYC